MAVDLTYDGTSRQVSTDAGALRYHEAGDGAPLLFLHGSGPGVTGWRNFRGVLGTFAEHFRCLILEFPGFGVSDDFGGHPMITAQGAVGTFVDALGLESVHIIGNSMGGGVGINYAIRHPSKVRRLVTIGGIGTNVFSPGPSEGIRLLQEFTENPSRQRLVDMVELDGVRPGTGDRRAHRGALGPWPPSRQPWRAPAACTARPRSSR